MIHPLCRDIITNLRINRFVETGTFSGETVSIVSEWLQKFDPDFGTIVGKTHNEYLMQFTNNGRVPSYPVFNGSKESSKVKLYSVDTDERRQSELALVFNSNLNIKLICATSEKFLKDSIDNGLFTDNQNCFFYLDAHWGAYWPLRDEIREILRLKRSVIVIDDFAVPFRLSAGFDVYKLKACSWFYIRDLFKNQPIHVYYPKKTNIDKRGSIFIFVGYEKKDLNFMKTLPCFEPVIKGEPFVTSFGILQNLFIVGVIIIFKRIGLYTFIKSLLSKNELAV
jgi:hypothetical protein